MVSKLRLGVEQESKIAQKHCDGAKIRTSSQDLVQSCTITAKRPATAWIDQAKRLLPGRGLAAILPKLLFDYCVTPHVPLYWEVNARELI